MPAGESTSPSCAAPSCEVALAELALSDIGLGIGGRNFSEYSNPPGLETSLQGSCADGKTFRAVLGPFSGRVAYFRDETAPAVGVAEYTPEIGKCECSGESWAGDVACPGISLELADAMSGGSRQGPALTSLVWAMAWLDATPTSRQAAPHHPHAPPAPAESPRASLARA